MMKDLTREHPDKILWRFLLPMLVSVMFQQIYNIADSCIAGRFAGEDALAAVGASYPITVIFMAFAVGTNLGASVVVSRLFGAKDMARMKSAVSTAFVACAFMSFFLTLIGYFFCGSMMRAVHTPENIFDDAYSYIMIITAGIVANIFYNLLSAYLRAVGNSKVPLFFLVFSACLNVILDLFFIIRLHMGVSGAAWATNLAQAISAVLCAIYIWCKIPDLKPQRNQWKLSRIDTKNQLAAGIPMALQFAITSSGTMIMQSAINLFGSTAVAAFTATGKLQSLLMQGMIAMGQTMATYSGQNFGYGDIKRIKAGVKTALWIALIYAVAVAALMCSLLKPSLHLFFSGDVDMATMLPWAQTYAYMCSMFFIPLSTIFIFRNTMQGCGYGFLPMMGGVAELFARLVVSVAAMKILNFRLACFGDPAAWIAAAVFTGVSYLFVMRNIERKRNGNIAAS